MSEVKVINTGGKAPLDTANCFKEVAHNETQGSRVVDYVFHVYGKSFCEELAKMDDYACGNKLNSIGFKAVPSLMFYNIIHAKDESIPLGEKYAKFYDEVTGAKSNMRKDDVVANGWKLLVSQSKPSIWDEKVMYIVDGRAMHKNVYEAHGSWEKWIASGGMN